MPRTEVAPLDKILEIAAEHGVRPYRAYSGRGMYGAECIGIAIGEDSFTDEHDVIAAARKRGIRGERTDSLGRGVIVYWPNIEDLDPEEDEA